MRDHKATVAEDVRQVWSLIKSSKRSLVATDLVYKLLAYVLITPAFVVLFQFLFGLSGDEVLSDLDLVYFLIGPLGWVCGLAVASLWLAILALEQASLLWILVQRQNGQTAHTLDALRFAAVKSISVLRVAFAIVARTVFVATPFLGAAALSYRWLLADFDINFYLTERPKEFSLAVLLGVALSICLMLILLRLFSSWFLALPLVLFEQGASGNALSLSKQLVDGHRTRIVCSLVIMAAVVFVANSACAFAIAMLGRVLMPAEVGSLLMLALRVGGMISLSVLSGMVVQLLAAIGFAATLLHRYQALSVEGSIKSERASLPLASKGSIWTRLTAWQLIVVGSILAVLATASGYRLINSVRTEDNVEVMAHRGASVLAPENSLVAFQRAIEDGTDWVEIDVQETSDGYVVVVHDKDLMKIAGSPLKVWESSWDQLSEVDIGSHADVKYSGERIAKLADVLRLCKDRVGVIIELKYYGHDQQLEERVVQIVESEGMADQVMVMSLDPRGVAKTKTLRPDWKYGRLMSVYVGNLRNIDADFLAVNADFANRDFIRRAHQAGKEVFVWTVDDPAKMSMLMNRKVDGILTNRPDIARDVIRQRAALGSSERLLAEISVWLGI
ncbi:glycerophosphodiester phosphodiesterase family protein [Rhodopirellula sp. MGV]|uniref:glycerophosphodiester phosphodiesterase family protein n=1 Tax=Rhodopirellula sp. MGV TaxID=2023130 RepID=UPI000B977F0B|nr:glycerophosphodiester phosphodiesterase family protein [Rhodopirellula sp. MGV]OYP36526.1 hypothetical protein CGZ80_07785 [Rhodopirellula sp. MGV]PNY34503.1 hypothetical protein C2E31_22600 [Rhodopirellula baltica]